MTTTAIIGCDSPIGKYWAAKRYMDCLINEQNMDLLRGRQFGDVVLVCPSLWDAPGVVKSGWEQLSAQVTRLMSVLGETKIERLTSVTTLDLIAGDGNEDAPVSPDEADACASTLAGFGDYINLTFGRVVTLRLAELVGLEGDPAGWSIVAELLAASKAKRKPKAGLLTKHQFYPLERIVRDAENAWECGLEQVNLLSAPVTVFELTEQLFPSLVDLLPTAKETDPIGDARTSKYAIYWNDEGSAYTVDKDSLSAVFNSLTA